MNESNEAYHLLFPSLPNLLQTPTTIQASNSEKNTNIIENEKGPGLESNDAYNMALDDVHTRFILNLPSNELSTADRIFFQLEQAYWFYDDFYCDCHDENSNESPLPRFKSLRHFCQTMFQISPLLSPNLLNFNTMWDEFTAYKRSISTYGTILLNHNCTKVVLCQDWNGKSWTFPAGKINQHETGIEAGARETYEETGFDIHCQLGITRNLKQASPQSITWKELISKDALTYTEDVTGKRRTCFVCRGVPEDFPFEPVARKEVSDVQWFDLNDLPKKTFAVLPLIGQLKKWIRKKGFGGNSSRQSSRARERSNSNPTNAQITPIRNRSAGRSAHSQTINVNSDNNNTSKKRGKRNKSRTNSRGKVREGDPLTQSGLANIGDKDGWTEDEMFTANERILGRQIAYDGNPHTFADAMANSNPHKFHIVGGSFMNSNTDNSEASLGSPLAPPPEKNKLQPLYNSRIKDGENEDKELKPFFSDGGKTPWGEVVNNLQDNEISQDVSNFGSNEKGLELLNILQKDKKSGNEEIPGILPKNSQYGNSIQNSHNNSFFTDSEITKKSQQQKLRSASKYIATQQTKNNTTNDMNHKSTNAESQKNEADDWLYLKNWVKGLERPSPSKHFGEFRFDVDAIMNAMQEAIK